MNFLDLLQAPLLDTLVSLGDCWLIGGISRCRCFLHPCCCVTSTLKPLIDVVYFTHKLAFCLYRKCLCLTLDYCLSYSSLLFNFIDLSLEAGLNKCLDLRVVLFKLCFNQIEVLVKSVFKIEKRLIYLLLHLFLKFACRNLDAGIKICVPVLKHVLETSHLRVCLYLHDFDLSSQTIASLLPVELALA